MTFASPVVLWGLLLIPLLVLAYSALQRRRARYAVRYSNLEVLASVAQSIPAWRRHVPALLYLIALAALVLGMARPQATVRVPRQDATVVMTIDTSGSMQATDVAPSRMAAAQNAAQNFVDQLPVKFQVGLVTFSETAQVLAQPTVDRVAVRESINSLEAEGPTAMGDAIMESLALNQDRTGEPTGPREPSSTPALQSTPSPSLSPDARDEPLDAILLLSDGYNTSGAVEPRDAAEAARESGVPVFTIALGTPEGTVEVPGAFGAPRLIRVPPDFNTLRAVAETTGGEFFTAPTEDDLSDIYNDLGSRIGFVEDHQEVTFAFAAAGALILVLGAGFAAAWSGRLP